MRLEEEVEHYLAGLRELDLVSTDATVTNVPDKNDGPNKVVESSTSEFHERPVELHHNILPAGCVQQVAFCDDFICFRQKAVLSPQAAVSLEVTAHSASPSTSGAISSVKGSTQDTNKSSGYSNKRVLYRALIARTQNAGYVESSARDRDEYQETNLGKLSDTGSIVDVAADAELDIIRHYASSGSSKPSFCGESVSGAGNDYVFVNEGDHDIQPASEHEEEDWDHCRVVKP